MNAKKHRPKGPPTHVLSVKVQPWLYRELQELAARRDRSVSGQVRRILLRELDRTGEIPESPRGEGA